MAEAVELLDEEVGDDVAVDEARADVAVGETRAVVAVAGRSCLGRAAVLLDDAVVDPAGGVLLLVHLHQLCVVTRSVGVVSGRSPCSQMMILQYTQT